MSILTKRVKDICDENKLAGVELDHRGVGQKLGALERGRKKKQQIFVFEIIRLGV